MRPRVFPAEDVISAGVVPRALGRAGFNEAAGIPRGRPHRNPGPTQRVPRFNEAAGIPRGRPTNEETRYAHPLASMRPRVFPAEDVNKVPCISY